MIAVVCLPFVTFVQPKMLNCTQICLLINFPGSFMVKCLEKVGDVEDVFTPFYT